MAENLSRVSVALALKADDFRKGLANVKSSTGKFSKQLSSLGAQASVAAAGIVALGFKSIKAFDEQAKAIAQVEAGLKSTGNQAGFTSDQLQDMASDLQKTTIFGDEAILKDVTAQLLTFTNLAGEEFDRTQKAALDLATRLDGDLKGASIRLGKALNDPVANLSALGESGIQFSVSQKEMIKGLVESGRLADAQSIILDELEKQYGGSAEAATVGAGAFQQLGNALGDLSEEFGAILVEYVTPLVKRMTALVQQFSEASPTVKKVIVAIAGIATAIGPVLLMVGRLIPLISSIGPVLTALTGPVGLIVLAVGGAVALIIAYWDEIKEYFTAGPGAEAFEKLKDVAIKAFDLITLIVQKFVQLFTAIWDQFGAEITAGFTSYMDFMLDIWGSLFTTIGGVLDVFIGIFTGDWDTMWGGIYDITKGISDQIISVVLALVKGITAPVGYLLEQFGIVEEGFVERGQAALEGLAEKMRLPAREAETTASSFDSLKASIDSVIGSAQTLSTTMAGGGSGQSGPMEAMGTLGPGTIGNNTPTPELQTGGQGQSILGPALDQANLDATIQKLAEFESQMEQVGQTFGDTFNQMRQDGDSFFSSFIGAAREAAKKFIKIALSEAIAGMIKNSLVASSNPGLAIALAAAAPALVNGLFANIPAFAQGGLVTGPQLAMVGDNPSGKEFIVPFEKMGKFLNMVGGGQGGPQSVEVYGRISGTDILLSNSRAQTFNNNTY